MTRNKVEDGMGFSGLVPSAAELRIDREQREEIQRLHAHINKQDAEIERLKRSLKYQTVKWDTSSCFVDDQGSEVCFSKPDAGVMPAYSLEIEGLVAYKHKLEAEVERLRTQLALVEVAAFSVNEELRAEIEHLRSEFKRFMDVCGEGSARGRALDLIDRRDWERAKAAVAGKGK